MCIILVSTEYLTFSRLLFNSCRAVQSDSDSSDVIEIAILLLGFYVNEDVQKSYSLDATGVNSILFRLMIFRVVESLRLDSFVRLMIVRTNEAFFIPVYKRTSEKMCQWHIFA